MRKFLVTLLVIWMAGILSSCRYSLPDGDLSSGLPSRPQESSMAEQGDQNASRGKEAWGPAASGQQSQDRSSAPSEEMRSGYVGDYEVVIRSARFSKDYQEKDVLIITYDFTNHSQNNMSFLIAIRAKAYQNGQELSMATVTGDKEYRIQYMMKDVPPGETQQVQRAFLLQDTTSPVRAEVSELIRMSTDCFSYTFDLSEISPS